MFYQLHVARFSFARRISEAEVQSESEAAIKLPDAGVYGAQRFPSLRERVRQSLA
jgi:hypothetical protein